MRYAPVLGGDDVVKLVDERKHVAGSRQHGAWFHGKVYLFVSEVSYEKFDKSPSPYAAVAEAVGSEQKALVSEKVADNEKTKRLGKQDTSLAWIPDNAAFYVSLLHCREQIEAVGQSRAWTD